jgi:hypothetical protein
MAQVIHGEFGPGVEVADTIAFIPQKTHSVAALNLSPKPGDVGCNLLLAERAVVEAKLTPAAWGCTSRTASQSGCRVL